MSEQLLLEPPEVKMLPVPHSAEVEEEQIHRLIKDVVRPQPNPLKAIQEELPKND